MKNKNKAKSLVPNRKPKTSQGRIKSEQKAIKANKKRTMLEWKEWAGVIQSKNTSWTSVQKDIQFRWFYTQKNYLTFFKLQKE